MDGISSKRFFKNHNQRIEAMAERYARGEDIWTGIITPESEQEFFENLKREDLTKDETDDILEEESEAIAA